MKVLCVNNDFPPNGKGWSGGRECGIGSIYSVIDTFTFPDDGVAAYELAEDPEYAYWVGNFAPISDIDETELVNQREKIFA
jgi:hypothetical protein